MSSKAEHILDHAQLLVQQRGFNAFSFRDLSNALDITTAGIHYHFSSKAELGQALIVRYRRSFMDKLREVDQQNQSAAGCLEGFARIYSDTLKANRFCLCGIMASEALTLPSEIYKEVQVFFEAAEHWLAQTLETGKENDELIFSGSVEVSAKIILSAIEGAMLTVWPLAMDDPELAVKEFENVASNFLRTFYV